MSERSITRLPLCRQPQPASSYALHAVPAHGCRRETSAPQGLWPHLPLNCTVPRMRLPRATLAPGASPHDHIHSHLLGLDGLRLRSDGASGALSRLKTPVQHARTRTGARIALRTAAAHLTTRLLPHLSGRACRRATAFRLTPHRCRSTLVCCGAAPRSAYAFSCSTTRRAVLVLRVQFLQRSLAVATGPLPLTAGGWRVDGRRRSIGESGNGCLLRLNADSRAWFGRADVTPT